MPVTEQLATKQIRSWIKFCEDHGGPLAPGDKSCYIELNPTTGEHGPIVSCGSSDERDALNDSLSRWLMGKIRDLIKEAAGHPMFGKVRLIDFALALATATSAHLMSAGRSTTFDQSEFDASNGVVEKFLKLATEMAEKEKTSSMTIFVGLLKTLCVFVRGLREYVDGEVAGDCDKNKKPEPEPKEVK